MIFLIKSTIKTLDSPLHHIWFLARHLNPTYYDKMKLQRLSYYCCRWKNAFEFRSCKLTPAMWRSFLNSQSPNTVCIRLFSAFAFQNRLTKLCVSQGRGSKTLYYKLQLSPTLFVKNALTYSGKRCQKQVKIYVSFTFINYGERSAFLSNLASNVLSWTAP